LFLAAKRGCKTIGDRGHGQRVGGSGHYPECKVELHIRCKGQLQSTAAPQLEKATKQQAETGGKVRLLGEVQYAAGAWEHERRVIIKTEILAKGPNIRFVVTARDDEPDALYNFYIHRGGGLEL